MIIPKLLQLPTLNFRDKLLNAAFTHRSVDYRVGKNYERLEFLGDAFLDFLIRRVLIDLFEDRSTGTLRSKLVSNKHLAFLADTFSMTERIRYSFIIAKHSKVKADVFEAYFGCWALALFSTSYRHYSRKVLESHWRSLTKWIRSLVELSLQRYQDPFFKPGFFQIEQRIRYDLQVAELKNSFRRFVVTLSLFENRPDSDGELSYTRSALYCSGCHLFLGNAVLNKYLDDSEAEKTDCISSFVLRFDSKLPIIVEE